MRLIATGLPARLFVAATALFAAAGVAHAQSEQVENLGTFQFWTAWKGQDANGTVCYVSSQPQDAQPTNVNRGPIHFLVVNRLGLDIENEVQTKVGYPLESGSTPQVEVDGVGFDMLVDGEAAWLASDDDEGSFVDAMKDGAEMVVEARSQRGTDTTDTYSLMGVTAALEKVEEDCDN